MAKQTLSIEQMQHLQELRLELKETMMRWQLANPQGRWVLVPSNMANLKVIGIPAYTLQDVLDALPIQIEIPLHPECGKYELRIKRMVFNTGKVMHAVVYEKSDYINWFVLQSHEKLIDAAYELLCWAIENKFVETNKNE